MGFYAFNLVLYAVGTVALAAAAVEGLMRHNGGQWKDLLLSITRLSSDA
jgi:hypothetical protein